MTQRGLFDVDPHALTIAPSAFLEARETSAVAALENVPRRSKQNTEVLRLITEAGDDGLSDRELARMTGYSRQTICLRRFDLRSLLTVAARRDRSIPQRPCCCWRRRRPEEQP